MHKFTQQQPAKGNWNLCLESSEQSLSIVSLPRVSYPQCLPHEQFASSVSWCAAITKERLWWKAAKRDRNDCVRVALFSGMTLSESFLSATIS